MAKGKWAQGIVPRDFLWVIQDQLAVCERPGGYGSSHRKVRREEEVIWIRQAGFSYIVSLLPVDHNLSCYDQYGLPWRHWPFRTAADLDIALPQIYTELQRLLGDNQKLLLHMEEVSELMMGLLAGYLTWTAMVPAPFEATVVIERIFGRQMGPEGRQLVSAAATAPDHVPAHLSTEQNQVDDTVIEADSLDLTEHPDLCVSDPEMIPPVIAES